MNVKEALIFGIEKLKTNRTESFLLDARILLEFSLNISHEQIILNPDKELTNKELEHYKTLLERRFKGEPISHILGKRSFWNYEFTINKNVLDPRPDSEALIESVLKIFPDKNIKLNILELGIGSGCLIITLLKEFQNAKGTGIDISSKALKIAQKNAENLNVSNRLNLIKSDWFNKINGKFDLIISNPPYIPSKQIEALQTEVKDYEPILALDGGKDGLDYYRKTAEQSSNFLNKNGYICLEIGQNQYKDVIEIFKQQGFSVEFYKKDLANIERIICFKKADNKKTIPLH
jgi:release factor glutamine methyltransferase